MFVEIDRKIRLTEKLENSQIENFQKMAKSEKLVKFCKCPNGKTVENSEMLKQKLAKLLTLAKLAKHWFGKIVVFS
jgi:hypothetical protein